MIRILTTALLVALAPSFAFAEQDEDYWLMETSDCVYDTWGIDNWADTAMNICLGDQTLDCEEGSDYTELTTRECMAAERKTWDTLLNRYYQKTAEVVATYEPNDQAYAGDDPLENFKQAQRDWLEYRDSECTAHTLFNYGGSYAKTEYGRCLLNMTAERAIFYMTWNCRGLKGAECKPWIN